jgi:NodT family efflux transporter outer membrane factor (OMF) lipoprotein
MSKMTLLQASRLRHPHLWGPGAVLLAAGLLVVGCSVGPDFKRPDAPAVDRYTKNPLPPKTASADVPGGEAQSFVQGQDIPSEWWTRFRSPALDALVARALKANPTLAAAHAALRQAVELVYAQEGYYYPTAGLGFSPSYQKSSASLSPPLNTNNLRYGLFTAQVNVSYAPDVFGGNRRQVESLQAQADALRFQREAAYVTLSTNVVAAAVQDASLRAQIAALREIVAIDTKSLDLLRRQLAAGAVTALDVAAQEAALAQAQQTLPPLEKQLEQNRHLMMALAGGFANDSEEAKFELAKLTLPSDLPVSLPSKLVEQRPDVRAAEAQLHAASALIGVAVAKRLPQFTIAGGYGGMATHIDKMFDPGNTFWSIVGSVTQSVFDGGTLLHQQRAAEAAFDQAAAQYRSIVIAGFQNVADCLVALQADAENLKAAVASERAAKVTLDITVRQQQLGQVNYLALLSSQQVYQQAVVSRAQAQAARLVDTAALFQALGGGWWNRSEDSPGN